MRQTFNDLIDISHMNGWIFNQGDNRGAAGINIDTTGWIHLKPVELSSKYADKTGRAEGWFRIKIKFDSSLLDQYVGFDFPNWAATELYIDGNKIASRGNTGDNGRPFSEYNGGIDPVSLRFETSTPHIFAIHFVAYVSPIPPHELKTATQQFALDGPNYVTTLITATQTFDAFYNLWLGVCAILSVLFWLLLFQNRREKNLFWIALCTTVLSLYIYCIIQNNSLEITYISYTVYNIIGFFLLLSFLLIITPVLLSKLFNRKINKKLLIFLIILVVSEFSYHFFPIFNLSFSKLIDVLSFLLVFAICFYYVITSWKHLRGAQWAIVVGLLFSVFSLIVGFTLVTVFKNLAASPYFFFLAYSCFILSLPVSLLVYVSIRFKEVIREVQLNAKRVIELSEEKKLHAENEQKILQEEVNRQTAEIRTTLDNLKSAQSQLIQSEKMASLGELTAGIAHEIQNPLNFVNNFSDVNKELLQELKEEADKGNIEDVKAIADNVIGNEEKINHHGKRADAIVKGMLQHSRQSSGQKEETDINTLADEYLRLSYHGLRAKDKNFNAEIKTDFDESIGKINVIPQDIGRVLLNLFNNAFYAVNEQKTLNRVSYNPTVSVKTEKCDDKIYITVKDNGKGIPQKIIDKIFQPFFTTKPTGQGTGLGLSLSYDIIKAHGGEIKVESKEGEGSEFVITLPIIGL
jgi:signal transduction histidine kinase